MAGSDTANGSGFNPENPYALTVIEQQVVDLLMAGLTGEEVGDLLGIDRRQVMLRRSGAMRKYGARNSLHLAHLVGITRRTTPVEGGVVSLEDVPSSYGLWVLADSPAT
jgi:DNA-binding CsgD family transcriptional regulator